jgi:Ca2+-binding RTX toxin-like protein
MTLEFDDNETPETATGTLPLGSKGYDTDSLSGSVGGDGDSADHFRIPYATGVQKLSIDSFGLWYAEEFTSRGAVAAEVRVLEIAPASPLLEGPTYTFTASYGDPSDAMTYDFVMELIGSSIETCIQGLNDPSTTPFPRDHLLKFLEIYLNALELIGSGVQSRSAALAAATQLHQIADQENSYVVRRAADLLERWLEPSFIITDGTNYWFDSTSLPFDTDVLYEVLEDADAGILKVTGSVYVAVVDTGSLDGIADYGGYHPMRYDIDISWIGPRGPTEFDDVLYGDYGVANTIHLLAGDDEYYGFSGDDTIRGERGDDYLDGGEGNDYLDGGQGADHMLGGAGNDIYWVDDKGDLADETPKGSKGTDIVMSTISFSLSNVKQAKGAIENLTLIGLASNGTGNQLGNQITGNSANNVLKGLGGNDTIYGNGGNDRIDGGPGADRMAGGGGNDVYVVDSRKDIVDESLKGSKGKDLVLSSVSFSLADAARAKGTVENLTLTGSAAIDGTGSKGANTITGNAGGNKLLGLAGKDVLIGKGGGDTLDGGAGGDVLTGGGGGDTFRFTADLGKNNIDRITDFTVGQDRIALDNAAMPQLGKKTGALDPAKFHKSKAGVAHDADDRVIYDTNDGKLYYDFNGDKPGGSFLIATLSPGLDLKAADIFVI